MDWSGHDEESLFIFSATCPLFLLSFCSSLYFLGGKGLAPKRHLFHISPDQDFFITSVFPPCADNLGPGHADQRQKMPMTLFSEPTLKTKQENKSPPPLSQEPRLDVPVSAISSGCLSFHVSLAGSRNLFSLYSLF